MPADPQVRTRRRRRRWLAVAVGLLAPLAALEVGVRLRHGHPVLQRTPLQVVEANALRGWQLVPGRDFYTAGEPVTVNALGLRGPEVGPKEPDELRVLALGDSMVFGAGVGDDATLPALLEVELEARLRRPVTVVNGGLPAYSTNQEIALLYELGPVLEPDLVVLFWFFNDVDEQPIQAHFERLTASGPVAFETGAPFEGWSALRWRASELLRLSALVAWARWQGEYRSRGNWSQATVDEAFGTLDAWVSQYARTREVLGAEPLAVVIPFSAALDGSERSRSHRSRDMERRAGEVFERHGVPVLATRPALEEAARRLGRVPHLPYDYHYDADGNRVQARAVAEWIAERLGG